MSRYFIKLAYNGTKYNGWQIQENTPNTIQQILQEKLLMLLQESIEVSGCGRTDTGVHARNFYANFNCETDLSENPQHWVYKLNTVLPSDISVFSIQKVKEDAHARFDATARTYHYYVHQHKNPFIENFSWYQYGPIDFELMNKAAEILLDTKDFTSFSKLHTQVKTNICYVSEASWMQISDNEWCFVITADRFLRNMVRAIVGTLLLVGRNKITLSAFKKIIAEKKRTEAGMSAPAHGLFLAEIQ
ncbi:MAG TPA: tRNA pseudouridine(38-40) synthase TruA, partial [Bacteroidia bacterium]|nr:tRNA pseudouridine(38-40) synthase TruA [Bacteroidia bacterium]